MEANHVTFSKLLGDWWDQDSNTNTAESKSHATPCWTSQLEDMAPYMFKRYHIIFSGYHWMKGNLYYPSWNDSTYLNSFTNIICVCRKAIFLYVSKQNEEQTSQLIKISLWR